MPVSLLELVVLVGDICSSLLGGSFRLELAGGRFFFSLARLFSCGRAAIDGAGAARALFRLRLFLNWFGCSSFCLALLLILLHRDIFCRFHHICLVL